jgi:tRNA nucleotidyltransferase (CCA-adding enzyme)
MNGMSLPEIHPTLPEELRAPCETIAEAVREAGGTACMVGGAVRDGLLGIPVKDVDIEVFGVAAGKLRELLRKHFFVIEVGASFGVFKLRGVDIDVSLPRRESKKGEGHKGFSVEGDPTMTIAEAAQRRDFTINALYRDLADGRLADPLGGEKDLQNGILRHCGPAFGDDPLRVLRAMQFVARFGMKVAPETLDVCRAMTMENLPAERLYEEWKKLLLKGRTISAGLAFLKDSTWLRFFPELETLVGCEQDKDWHPEGDAWMHTLHCMDAYATLRTGDEYEDMVVGLATLCHDLGKPRSTFTDENGRIRAFGHDVAGEEPTRAFLERITRQKQLVEDVVSLVKTHMQTTSLYKSHAGMAAIRRLAMKVRIDRLVRLTRADMRGTPPVPHDEAPCDWLLEKAHEMELQSTAPKPIMLGRHLIHLGLKPGPDFTSILDALFEAQLEGEFVDEAGGIEIAKKLIAERK